MPTVTISWPNVLVDGTSFGKVADTIANNKALASDIQRALEAERTTLEASHAAALKAVQDEKAAVQAQLDKRIALQNELIATAKANINNHDVLKAVVAEADKPELDRKKADLDAQISALQDQRATLQ